MRTANYTTIRNNLAKALDQVNEDRSPILITRQRGKPAVLISLEEFNAWQESAHLMRSARNAARLDRAVRDLDQGKGVTFDPFQPSSGLRRRSKIIGGGRKRTRKSPSASKR